MEDEDYSDPTSRYLVCLYRSNACGAAFTSFARLEVSQGATSPTTVVRADADHWARAYHGTDLHEVPNIAQYGVMFHSQSDGNAWTQVIGEKQGKKQLVQATLSIITLPGKPLDDAAAKLIRTTMIQN